jgi:hypothetical protein
MDQEINVVITRNSISASPESLREDLTSSPRELSLKISLIFGSQFEATHFIHTLPSIIISTNNPFQLEE